MASLTTCVGSIPTPPIGGKNMKALSVRGDYVMNMIIGFR